MNSKNDNIINSSSSTNNNNNSSHHYNIHHHYNNNNSNNNSSNSINNSNSNNHSNLFNNSLNLGNHHHHHHHHHHHNGSLGSVSSSAPSLNGLNLNSNGLNAKLFANNNLINNNNNNLNNSNSIGNNNQSSSGMIQPQQQILMNSPSVNMAAVAAYGQQPALLQQALNPNSNTTNQNNQNNHDELSTFAAQKLMQLQSIPWFEVEIKGMVKNISPKLWQWTHLRCLYLNDNNLMRLPPIVSSLVNLQCLDVSNNKIRTLPAEIGDMTTLRELYLNNNQIRVLPFELGKLFKLQQLGLKGNPLTPDMMQIYMEPNGTQKLLIHLLDQLTITCPPPNRRPWMLVAEPKPNTTIFTTMCYNVLCDKYATRNYYGYCPAWALTWDYRKKLILDDIKLYDADVIALQELETEQFYQYFLPELKQADYDGIFSPKSRAKTMSEQDKKHVDGCAIFFKTTRFQLVKDYLIEFNQIAMATAEGSEDMLNRVMTKDNIALAALLEVKQDDDEQNDHLANNQNNKSPTSKDQGSSSSSSSSSSSPGSVNNKQLILVCTAHIHWDPDYCDVKLIQTLMFTNEIKLIMEQAMKEFRPHQYAALTASGQNIDCSHTIPVVICADLNSLPESGVIEYLRTGRILANHVDFKDLGYDSCLQKINTSDRPSELSHNLKLDSAYDKEIMPYTNYTYDFKGMIDYIFYSRNLMRTLGFLGALDSDWIKTNRIVGFPHPHVASDHLPLIVELELFNAGALSVNGSSSSSQQHQQHQHHNQHNNLFQQQQSSSGMRSNQNNNSHHSHHHHSGNNGTNSNNGVSLHHSNSSTSGSASMLGQMLLPLNTNSSTSSNITNSNSNNNNTNSSGIGGGNFNFNMFHSNSRK